MKILLLLLFISTTTFAMNSQDMRFTYRSYDGQLNYSCDHKLANDLAHIWDIYCFDDEGNQKKKFVATVWISRYTRTRAPVNTYELIYRISHTANKTSGGSTHWINLKKDAPLHSLTLSQSVENDLAGLYLEVSYGK